MPKKTDDPKKVLLATRVTPDVRQAIEQLAQREDLNISEWLRNLILAELERN
jgi:hypothetical protein